MNKILCCVLFLFLCFWITPTAFALDKPEIPNIENLSIEEAEDLIKQYNLTAQKYNEWADTENKKGNTHDFADYLKLQTRNVDNLKIVSVDSSEIPYIDDDTIILSSDDKAVILGSIISIIIISIIIFISWKEK